MRTTLAPVLLNAGFRSNVIPGTAQATLNVRIIPGTDVDALRATLERVIGDPLVSVTFANPAAAAAAGRGTPSSEATDLFRALERHARATFPGAEVTPYLFQAGTDAGAWRTRNVPVYSIYPYPDHRRGADAHARQRRTGERRIVAGRNRDDLQNAARRGCQVARQGHASRQSHWLRR